MLAGGGRVRMDVVPYALTDAEGRVAGLNRVGLRRAGIPRDHVADLRNAFRILFSTGSPLENRLEQLVSAVQSPPGRRLLQFVKATSNRGLAGRSRRTAIGLGGEVD
jgi:UDP-N-acetylglucosamine acyltransferase